MTIFKVNGTIITNIKSMNGRGTELIKSRNGNLNLDPHAWKFLSTANIEDQTIISAINTFCIDMKADGLFAKFYAIWPVVGGSATPHSLNLIDTTTYQLSMNGTITHAATGMAGNGINGYIDTNLNDNTVLSQNDCSIWVYCRTNLALNGYNDLHNQGGVSAGANRITTRNNSNQYATACHCSTTDLSIANSDSRGLYGLSRQAAANYVKYKNTTGNTITQASDGKFNGTFWSMRTGAVYSTREYCFYGIATGLDATEEGNLYANVQALQTALSRNV